MVDITKYMPRSGQIIKDDGNLLNEGTVLADIYDSTNHVLKTAANIGKYPECTPVTQDSAANTLNTVTIAGVAAKKHNVMAVSVAISGLATAAVVTILIKDGATTKWKEFIPSGAAIGTTKTIYLNAPLAISTAADLVVSASQAGASSITTINVLYYDA